MMLELSQFSAGVLCWQVRSVSVLLAVLFVGSGVHQAVHL